MKIVIQPVFWLVATVLLTSCLKQAGDAGQPGAQSLELVAQAVARKEDRASADELAGWIIAGQRDFTLIDIRSTEEYEAGHIEGARNLPISELVSAENLGTLPMDRKVIVYSQGSENAAQAAVMLRLAGYNALLLLGGYNFWSEHVLNPDIPPVQADGETPAVAKQRAIACYFAGGEAGPRAAETVQVLPRQAPAFTPPLAEPTAPPRPKIDEGC